jgi:DNA processing protein
LDVLDARERAHREPLLAWLALQQRYALAPLAVPEALRRAAPAAVAAPPALATPLRGAAAERLLTLLARQGVIALPIASPAYPERLRRLRDAPALLLVRGTPALLLVRSVAMVGARAPTAYGLATARRLAFDLARAGLAVVSGLARGIDAAAHEGALAAGGATVAFQACGPERVYPRQHRALAERIAGQGAVLTELPVGTPPRAAYFPLRNRLISALAEAVIVVEARERSGSLVTARCAADQGVDVWAVPGPLDAPTSLGPNRLIQQGAGLLIDAADVLRALAIEAAALPRAAVRLGRPADPLAAAIVRTLRRQPQPRDALAAALSAPPGAFAAALLELELAGALREDRDGRLRVIAAAVEPPPAAGELEPPARPPPPFPARPPP